MSSVNNNIPFVPENTIDPAAGLNESINVIDALLQVAVVSIGANTPPGSPAAGDRYIVGTSPTGTWSGQANKLARWLDGTWSFFDARYVISLSDNKQYIRGASGWSTIDSSGEWSAETVSQAEAEAGTATTRRAWTAERVRQAIVAWWNSVSSVWGRGFVASADAAAGRTALGLGNAATATVQSSNTDSTPVRLMFTGAFGLGTDGVASRTRPTDCNAATVSGFYAVGGTTLNRPPAAGSSAGLLEVYAWESSATIKFQRFLLVNTGNAVSRTFTRFTDASGVWGDWAEILTQRSILGTVSQSAGIPTGAIIERGSNANGEYVRFADGTQICTVRRQVNLAIDIAFVGGFRSSYESWTYPANFTGTSTTSLQGSAPATAHGLMFQGDGSSGVNIAVLAPTSVAAGTRIISASAIGRWY